MSLLPDFALDRLERYLGAPERPESTMPLDAVQGLLCAVVSAPAAVMPSRWLPAVLGDGHEFSTEAERGAGRRCWRPKASLRWILRKRRTSGPS